MGVLISFCLLVQVKIKANYYGREDGLSHSDLLYVTSKNWELVVLNTIDYKVLKHSPGLGPLSEIYEDRDAPSAIQVIRNENDQLELGMGKQIRLK